MVATLSVLGVAVGGHLLDATPVASPMMLSHWPSAHRPMPMKAHLAGDERMAATHFESAERESTHSLGNSMATELESANDLGDRSGSNLERPRELARSTELPPTGRLEATAQSGSKPTQAGASPRASSNKQRAASRSTTARELFGARR